MREKKDFSNLFEQIEKSPGYTVEGLKVEIAEMIYLAMQRSQVHQAELARLMGKSRAYITKVLSGNVNFTLETMVSIADALDCEVKIAIRHKRSPARVKQSPDRSSRNGRAKTHSSG